MISYRDISLSADEKYVSFVEVDRTEIRKRSVLVPGDPSYPGVTERQFARVGGRGGHLPRQSGMGGRLSGTAGGNGEPIP